MKTCAFVLFCILAAIVGLACTPTPPPTPVPTDTAPLEPTGVPTIEPTVTPELLPTATPSEPFPTATPGTLADSLTIRDTEAPARTAVPARDAESEPQPVILLPETGGINCGHILVSILALGLLATVLVARATR